MRDNEEYLEGVARIIRGAAILAGLAPLADMSEDEVAWVFDKLAGDCPLVGGPGNWVAKVDCYPALYRSGLTNRSGSVGILRGLRASASFHAFE